MNEPESVFDVPEFGMAYEDELDLDNGSDGIARGGSGGTVQTIFRQYMLDANAWHIRPVIEQIETVIAARPKGRSPQRRSEINRRCNMKRRGPGREEAARRWNGEGSR